MENLYLILKTHARHWLLACFVLLQATLSYSQFSGSYAPVNWSLVLVNGGNGSVNTAGAPASITMTGNDNTNGGAFTYYQIAVSTTGAILFDYSIVHNDPGFDVFGYTINGVNTPVASASGSGTIIVSVTAGDIFAFYADGADGCCGTFTSTISNFQNSASIANPCDNTNWLAIPTCATPQTFTLSGSGVFSNSFCGFSVPGEEQIFSFTPVTTGMHTLDVTGGNGWIDYGYKNASSGCSSSGWSCIGDVFSSASITFGPLTAGQTYLILAEAEGTISRTHTISIGCPDPCGATVSAPYLEDFESFSPGLTGIMGNGWASSTTSNPKWETEDASGFNENSSGTGPFYDNTFFGTSGGMYVFLETSGGSLGSTSMLTSPCINLGTLTNPALKFWYHMYGASMGELRVDISTDQGATWVLDIASPLIGQQQTAGSDPWLQQTVSLSSYVGQQIKLRFRGIRGSSFTGDMSLDDIQIFNQSSVDLGITDLVNPVSSGACGAFGPSVPVEITLYNNGAATHDFSTDPATITANITGPVPSSIVYVHNTGTLATGASLNVIIGNGNFSSGGIYNVNLNVTVAGDGNALNNDYAESVENQTITSFPFLEDFESTSPGETGAFSNGWTSSTTSDPNWETEISPTGNSSSTGPFYDHTLYPSTGGMYTFLETSGGSAGQESMLISPCIDFTLNNAPAMSFWYHMYGATIGELHVDVSTDNGATWIMDVMTPIIGQQQTGDQDPWLQETVLLDAYAGQQVLIRFRGSRGSSFTGDMAIDDINLYQQPPCDPLSLTAGTATISAATACAGESIDLAITGYTSGLGLTIQWEESMDNSTWTALAGANTAMYTISSIATAGTHYYKAIVTCAAVSATSNTVSVTVSEPLVLSTTGDTRCGSGIVNLQATTNAGSSLNWYAEATGGSSLGSGTSYMPFVVSDSTFYVEASSGGGTAMAPLPAQLSSFSGNVRGHWFTAPTSFNITGLNVPGATGFQSIAVISFNPAIPPPTFAGTTNDFTVLYLTQNNPNTGVLPVNIPVNAGDVIGILGQDQAGTAYGPTGAYTSMINGFPVDLTRMGMQFSLHTNSPQSIWQEPGGALGLIQMTYSSACTSPRTAVSATVTPAPQVEAGANRQICNGDSTILAATGGGYTNHLWISSEGDSLSGQSVTVAPDSAITYYLIADDGNCGDTDTLYVDVFTITAEVSTDKTTVCGNDSAQFNVVIPSNQSYTYNNVPFSPIAGSGTAVSLGDDQVSAALPIGFAFEFFGISYTDFYISSNGFLAFNNANILDNGCCTGQSLPNTSAFNPHNLIAFAWEDLDPLGVGTIEYFTVGSAPNRILVMNFIDIPHFPGPGPNDNVTSQVLLYEGSNNIEIHTTSQPATSGNHTMGIENATGTEALTVAGRNAQTWTASNEGIRFTPPAPAPYTYNWSPATGVSDPTSADPLVLPPLGTPTTYSVLLTHIPTGCTRTYTLPTLQRFDPQITSTTGDTRCGLGNVSLSATGDGPVDWYDQASGGTLLHTGNSYNPFVTETTNFYVETTGGGVSQSVGAVDNTIGAGANYTFFGDGLVFDVLQPVTINTVYVYPNAAGNVVVNIENSSGALVQSVTVAVSTPGVKTAVPLGISLPAGSNYEMNATGSTTGGLFRNSSGAVYPYTSSAVHITNAINSLAGFYYFFYDWQITTGCVSPRLAVTANVNPAPVIDISGTHVLCEGQTNTLTITTGAGDYTNFDWSPAAGLNTTSGTTVQASPVVDTEYIVFASGNVNGCQNADTFFVDVTPAPPLALTSSGTFFCDVANATLSTGGGGSPTVTIGTGTSASTTSAGPLYISSASSTFKYSRHISIYTAAEIIAAGGTAGIINQISWYRATSVGGYTAGNAQFDIYIKPVSFSTHASSSINWNSEVAGATLVYSSTTQNINTTQGWQDFVFNTPFNWNGTDNLEIFVDWHRPSNAVGATSWRYTSTTNANAISGGSSLPSSASRNSNRPNVMFGFQQSLSYAWSPATDLSGTTGPTVTATPSTTTTYSVVVTDNLTGCTSTDNVTIVVEATPTPVITSSIAMPLCEGDFTTLSTQYTAANGYLFDWNSFLTTETISASLPGPYTVIVTSTNGCSSTPETFTIEVATIFADMGVITPVLCHGDSTGTATVDALGTIYNNSGNLTFGPFSYSAYGSAYQANPTITGLWAGNHNISVYDSASGCSIILLATVTEPPPLVASTTVTNNVSCFGGNDGFALGTATGGVGPYSFIWQTPVPKESDILDNVGAGTFTLVVIDANGCVDSATVTISEPPLLTVNLGADDIVLWGSVGFDGCDTINPITNGGTAPYTWTWSSPDDPNLSGGASGPYYVACNQVDTVYTYIVVVTDANGCTATDTLELLFANVNCSNNSNQVKYKVCHVPPGNPENCKTICVQASAIPAMLAQGSYMGTCLKKCAIPASARTTVPVSEVSLEISPNPTSGKVGIMFLSDYDIPSHIVVMDMQGRELMRVQNDMGNNFFREIDLGMLSDGIYLINIMKDGALIKNSKLSITH